MAEAVVAIDNSVPHYNPADTHNRTHSYCKACTQCHSTNSLPNRTPFHCSQPYTVQHKAHCPTIASNSDTSNNCHRKVRNTSNMSMNTVHMTLTLGKQCTLRDSQLHNRFGTHNCSTDMRSTFLSLRVQLSICRTFGSCSLIVKVDK